MVEFTFWVMMSNIDIFHIMIFMNRYLHKELNFPLLNYGWCKSRSLGFYGIKHSIEVIECNKRNFFLLSNSLKLMRGTNVGLYANATTVLYRLVAACKVQTITDLNALQVFDHL